MTPLLILATTPSKKLSYRGFFRESNNPVREYIANPKHLRYSGWNLLTLDTPTIQMPGVNDSKENYGAWEVKNGDRKIIQVFEDGTILAIAKLDSTFLGWGQNEEGFSRAPRINPIALVEYIYEYVRFCSEIFSFAENNNEIGQAEYICRFTGVKISSEKALSLSKVKVTDFLYSFHSDEGSLEEDFEDKLELDLHLSNEKIAYKILQRIYLRAHIAEDKIPYTNPDTEEVDIASIVEKG